MSFSTRSSKNFLTAVADEDNKETFLLADTSIEVVLGIPFLILRNVDVLFSERELIWRFYLAAEALSTTKRMKIIDKKEFAKAALDENVEAFVVYMISFNRNSILIHLAREAQIALLVIEKVQIPFEYLDFSDVSQKKKFQSYWRQPT